MRNIRAKSNFSIQDCFKMGKESACSREAILCKAKRKETENGQRQLSEFCVNRNSNQTKISTN